MHDIWIALINGIVEGLTEFLPVSSTGHLKLVDSLTGFGTDPRANTFDIVIQLGAILAVVVLYFKKVMRLIGIRIGQDNAVEGPKLNLLHIIIGCLPASVIGLIANNYIDKLLSIPEMVLIGLVIGGVYMIIAERYHPKIEANDVDQITYRQAFYIGVAQILSLWPGFSRSGSTIAAGMLTGASRAAAADFTFIMAIPLMAAASGLSLLKNYKDFSAGDFGFLAIGFIVSFLVALVAVGTFIRVVGKLKLTVFAYYRFVLAGVFLIYILM